MFASLDFSLVYQCEAPQIEDDLGDWSREGQKKKRQLFGVDLSGAKLM